MQESTDFMDFSPIDYNHKQKEHTVVENQGYYRTIHLPDSHPQIDAEPLVVNCAGCCNLTNPFVTNVPSGRDDYYLQVMTEGRLTAWIDGVPQDFSSGMFILYKPHTPYRYALAAGEAMTYNWVHFTGFHAGRLLSTLGIEPGRLYRFHADRDEADRWFGALFREFIERGAGFDDACGARLTLLLTALARCMETEDATPLRSLKSLRYLHCHYTEDISIAELAAMEHLSESRYRSVFRDCTGFSPNEYRIALRMQRACDLLLHTGDTLAEIAQSCGYGDTLYFSRIFKQKLGMTPGEYRQKGEM